MYHFLQADRRLWKAPLVSQLFPFLWAEPHHADVSLFCERRSWQSNFSNGCSQITSWVARFPYGKVMAQSSCGSLSHKRICLLYSIFKDRGESPQRLSSVKAGGRAGKRGIEQIILCRQLPILRRFLNQSQSLISS